MRPLAEDWSSLIAKDTCSDCEALETLINACVRPRANVGTRAQQKRRVVKAVICFFPPLCDDNPDISCQN